MTEALVAFNYSSLAYLDQTLCRQTAGFIRDLHRQSVENALKAGKLLAEVNERLAHYGNGTFAQWVRFEVDISPATAYRYMRLYRRFGDRVSVTQTQISLTGAYLMASPSTPESAVLEIEMRLARGEQLGTEQVESLISVHKAAEAAPAITDVIVRTAEARGAAAAVSQAKSLGDTGREVVETGTVTVGEQQLLPTVSPAMLAAAQIKTEDRQHEHMAANQSPGATAISIVVYKGDPARTLKALHEVLPVAELYRLQDLIATRK